MKDCYLLWYKHDLICLPTSWPRESQLSIQDPVLLNHLGQMIHHDQNVLSGSDVPRGGMGAPLSPE